MDVTWHGISCFRLRGKNANVVTDPYPSAAGARLPRLEADLVTLSHSHPNHSNLDAIANKDAFVVDGPGEYEVKGITVFGIRSFHDSVAGAEQGQNTIYVLEIDDVRLCHLGDLGHTLDDETVEAIGTPVDVLMVPVGGGKALAAARAAEVVRAIEPRWVVPMHYGLPGFKVDLEEVDTFLKEMGVTEVTAQPKLVVQYSGSGEGDTKVFLMEPRT
ncbi:MAG TPA: MBL fold metallo-hydrolase [Candidatus Dormibacteraeota bacterium]|nr:MBL fold metallo-hydrolase [Candidatus Dormibacteraeota bacterium]